MKLMIEEIVKAIGGRLISGSPERVVTGVSTDTRTVQPGDLFVALKGERHDGHDHVKSALEKEAAAVIVERKIQVEGRVILVGDTLKALGDLAHFWRCRFAIPVVAVTGSNGKTTTKDLIASFLSTRFRVLKTEGNFNNLIGLPLTLFRLEASHELAVLEMGMNRPGEIRRLAEIAVPKVGVITNIARAHLEGLGTIAKVARAKAELLEKLPKDGLAVLNAQNAQGPSLKILKKFVRSSVRVFGKEPTKEKMDLSGTSFLAKVGGKTSRFKTSLLGRHNVLNALAAIAVADEFRVPVREIKKSLADFQGGSKRMEVLSLKRGIQVINDCYNANPDSTEASLQFLKEGGRKRRRVAVLGEMLELGAQSARLHREIGLKTAKAGVKLLFSFGPHARDIVKGARKAGMRSKDAFAFETLNNDHLEKMFPLLEDRDLVLVKGSRGMRMEQVTERLKNVL